MLHYRALQYLLALFSLQLLSTIEATLTPTAVATFSNTTWLENLVVRSGSNDLLVSTISAPEVFLVPTNTTSTAGAPVIATIPNATSCLGIAELRQDVFYVLAGNFTFNPTAAVPGSYSLQEINLSGLSCGRDAPASGGVQPRHIATLPRSGFLNGLTVLDSDEGIVLAADSAVGCVWSINVHTGVVKKVIADPTMDPVQGAELMIGVNGLKVHSIGDKTFLYYDNSNQASLHRIEIDPRSGLPLQVQELLYQGTNTTINPDDFAVDTAGAVWMASDEQILRFSQGPNGWEKDVVVDDPALRPTAVVFGQSKAEMSKGTIYVSNQDGLIVEVDVEGLL